MVPLHLRSDRHVGRIRRRRVTGASGRSANRTASRIDELIRRLADPSGPFDREARVPEPHRAVEGPAVQAAPRRAHAAALLHVRRRDEVSRQPDRLGRPALPPRHDGVDQRGDAALRAGLADPRPPPRESAASHAADGSRPTRSCRRAARRPHERAGRCRESDSRRVPRGLGIAAPASAVALLLPPEQPEARRATTTASKDSCTNCATA